MAHKRPVKKTVTQLRQMKDRGQKIVMITAYDASFARLFDKGGADIVLVGDSLGMVIQGQANTLGVTLEDMVYHGRAVSRGLSQAHLTVDLPFMSYQVSANQALESAGQLVKEGLAESVKLEGGVRVAQAVEKIVHAGIPVMGHVGLTPQSVHAMGGFKVQGRLESEAKRILEDAEALEEAGCFSVVLEGIPSELAAQITERLSIPTIGIGAGKGCDGQVLVCYDMLGMDDQFTPKFLKKYENLHQRIGDSFNQYADEVRKGLFPAAEHSFRSEQNPHPLTPKSRRGYGAE